MQRSIRPIRWALLALFALRSVAAGEPLETGFESDQAKEEFLRTAKIVERTQLETGVTGSFRFKLSDGVRTHGAHVQIVDEHVRSRDKEVGEYRFVDSYRYNVAAYRIDRMVGLGAVPVSVVRRTMGTLAAMTWWVDDVAMMEKEQKAKGLAPPDVANWNHQYYVIQVIQELISNRDQNTGNLLITGDWRLVPIDFTRAFRPHRSLIDPEGIGHICPKLLRGLEALEEGELQGRLKGVLTKPEIRAMMARRDLLLARIAELAAQTGGGALRCQGIVRMAMADSPAVR